MKDHDNFVKAAAMFVETAPEARFALIGAGTNEQGSALDRAIGESGIAERFVRLGLRQDLCRLHAALDHRHPELGIWRRISQRPGGGDGMRRALRRH